MVVEIGSSSCSRTVEVCAETAPANVQTASDATVNETMRVNIVNYPFFVVVVCTGLEPSGATQDTPVCRSRCIWIVRFSYGWQTGIDPLLTVVGVGFAEMKRSGEPLTWTESLVYGHCPVTGLVVM
jgi:hypothetical protein